MPLPRTIINMVRSFWGVFGFCKNPPLRKSFDCVRLPPAGVVRQHIALVRSCEEHRRVKECRSGSDECTCAHSKARENESSLIINYSFHVIADRGCSLYHKRIFPVFM